LAKLQANATFGKTMEQVRKRQNTYLRSEFTPFAKLLALGITPSIPITQSVEECLTDIT